MEVHEMIDNEIKRQLCNQNGGSMLQTFLGLPSASTRGANSVKQFFGYGIGDDLLNYN